MISPILFSAVTRKEVKAGAIIRYNQVEDSPAYKVVDNGTRQKKKGNTETVKFLVEPNALPPLAMKYTIGLELAFTHGINNDYDRINLNQG